MAERYGGQYSPDRDPEQTPPQKAPFEGQVRSRVGGRVNLLFIAPLPLALAAFFGSVPQMALRLAGFGLMILAAWLTREGLLAEEAYHARKIARRPAMPRKIAGSLLTGLGLGLAGLSGGNPLNALIFAVIGTALHAFAFGLDPLKNKGMEGIDEFQTDRVARAVGEAEAYLTAMYEAIARTKDRELQRRVESFQTTARAMFRSIEDDPQDLTAARKYLSVYLMGARDASVKFADIYTRSREADARRDYVALLNDLESNFTAQTRKLLMNDRSDLSVEIEVLRDRLAREGVVAKRNNGEE